MYYSDRGSPRAPPQWASPPTHCADADSLQLLSGPRPGIMSPGAREFREPGF